MSLTKDNEHTPVTSAHKTERLTHCHDGFAKNECGQMSSNVDYAVASKTIINCRKDKNVIN